MMKTLLFDEYPLTVSPTLAAIIGLDKAVFIQQIHFFSQNKALNPQANKWSFKDGYYWVVNSYEQWADLCPYLGSARTIQRMAKDLMDLEILVVIRPKKDSRYWYRIDHDVLRDYIEANIGTILNTKMRAITSLSSEADANLAGVQETDCHVGTSQNGMCADANLAAHTNMSYTNKSSNKSNKSNIVGAERSTKKKEMIPFETIEEWFENWWATLPTDRRLNKSAAFRSFVKPKNKSGNHVRMTPDIYQQIMTATTLYNAHIWQYRETRFKPHPKSFLNSGAWMDSEQDIISAGNAEREQKQQFKSKKRANVDLAIDSWLTGEDDCFIDHDEVKYGQTIEVEVIK